MAVLNRKEVLERLGGDEELYADICHIFLRDVPMMIERLHHELEVGRLDISTRYVYSIKSIASNVGADDLMELARTAEMAGRTGDAETLLLHLPKLEAAYKAVAPMLPSVKNG